MKLMGAALLTAAGLLCGLMVAAGLRSRLRAQRSLCRMLAVMGFELERFCTPLPELFASLSERLEGEAAALCRRTAAGLAAGGRPFAAVWSAAISVLPEAERGILAPLAEVLGRYGAQEQCAAVLTAEAELGGLRDGTAARLREKSRLYTGLFTAGGLLLAVLLM